jgi:hypothetical protein
MVRLLYLCQHFHGNIGAAGQLGVGRHEYVAAMFNRRG